MATTYLSSAQDVFHYWISTSTYTSTDTLDNIWYRWHDSSTSNTATPYTDDSTLYTDAIWGSWQVETPKHTVVYKQNYMPITPKRSQEEERAIKAQREINKIWGDIKIMEEHRRKEHAELTALKLLEDLVNNEALAHYKETGKLVVKGRKFDYVIQKGRGVYKVEKEKVLDLCIHFKNRNKFPETDNVIGLKLMIEGNEKRFLATANNHGELRNGWNKDKILSLVGDHNKRIVSL